MQYKYKFFILFLYYNHRQEEFTGILQLISVQNTMNNKSPQEEMMCLIQNCIASGDPDTAHQCLNIYKRTFGFDHFYEACELTLIRTNGPLVSLICIHDDPPNVAESPHRQEYSNLEVVSISAANWESEVISYLQTISSKYVCFCEPGQKYEPNRIAFLVSIAENLPDVDGVICTRHFIDTTDTIIAHSDPAYQNALDGKIFTGQQLLDYSIANNVNLYGNLSTLLLSTAYVKQLSLTPAAAPDSMRLLAFLYQLLLPAKVTYTYLPLVSTILQPYTDSSTIRKDYEDYLRALPWSAPFSLPPETNPLPLPCQRDITFFYTDKGEYHNLKPVADEAKRRGYKITFTENLTQKAEIGVYCQHVCHPENAKFSLILLHDLAQGHNRWPSFWELERWNGFDIGIVPGSFWSSLWAQSACQYYANPKYGVYELGYPKSDLVHSDSLAQRTREIREKLNLKYNVSILYAPSWENDGKEHDFISALHSLPVNLLIKQAHWSDKYTFVIENIRQMRALHEGKYENVYYIEPEESIMTALALCDMVVSDESSVMAEAFMFGKPSIAVPDWLIPDTTPSRFASVPMEYVIKCKKSDLKETAQKLMQEPEQYQNILTKGALLFSNAGHCCADILDAIEYFTAGEPRQTASPDFIRKKVASKYAYCTLWN